MPLQLDLFRRVWLVRTIAHNREKAPDGSGHLYDGDSALDAERQHNARRASGRFPWLGFPISITVADDSPEGPGW